MENEAFNTSTYSYSHKKKIRKARFFLKDIFSRNPLYLVYLYTCMYMCLDVSDTHISKLPNVSIFIVFFMKINQLIQLLN
jgi:hypothetical protein